MLKRVICYRSDWTQQTHLPLEPGDDGLRIKTEGASHLEGREAPLFRGTVNRHGTYLKQVCHFRHFERPLSLLQIFNQYGYGFSLHSRFTSLFAIHQRLSKRLKPDGSRDRTEVLVSPILRKHQRESSDFVGRKPQRFSVVTACPPAVFVGFE